MKQEIKIGYGIFKKGTDLMAVGGGKYKIYLTKEKAEGYISDKDPAVSGWRWDNLEVREVKIEC